MNMGIIEMAAHFTNDKLTLMRRVEIGEVITRNNEHNVPAGFTAVYIRSSFFHVFPDEFLPVVKDVFFPAYEWDAERQKLTGLPPLGSHYYYSKELTEKYQEWASTYL